MSRQALRSNFEPGSTRWAVRHAQWSAMGIAEADFDKPKIAVVNTSSGLSVCFQHLDGIAKRVAAAIRAAGGLPLEVVGLRHAEAEALYQRRLVLVRPDGTVAWRADAVPADAARIVDTVRGMIAPSEPATPRPAYQLAEV